MNQENFWVLLSKKIAGEASPEELAELERLVQQHPEWQYAIQNLQDIWHSDLPADTSNEEDAYLIHLQRMKEKNIRFEAGDEVTGISFEKSRSSRNKLRILYASMAIAASLIVAFFLFNRSNTEDKPGTALVTEASEISTRLGSKSRIQLPDGSIVWINAGSKLAYHKDFGKINREVELSGEAFFDVVKDKTRPFLIHTSAIDIKVLGTAFNVRAYPDDKTTEASLIRGSIEVSVKSRPNDKVILSPNEKLVVENRKEDTLLSNTQKEPLIVINSLKHDPRDSSIAEMQWTENKLVFDDELFTDIAVKMERWFNVEIEISDSRLAEKRLTGKFDGESIEQALESLAYTSTTSFVFERKGNKIFIHR